MNRQIENRKKRWNSHGHKCDMCKGHLSYPENKKKFNKYCDDCIERCVSNFRILMTIMKYNECYPPADVRKLLFALIIPPCR